MHHGVRIALATLLTTVVATACATAGRDGDDASRDAHVTDARALDARAPDAAARDTGPADAPTVDAPVADSVVPTPDAAACAEGATQACATTCGSTGTATCAAGAWSACAPPAESCNLVDDDCNGACDDVLGCRVRINRSFGSANGQHFYTSNDAEATCCGYTLESHAAFYLFGTMQPGLVPLYRCRVGAEDHLLSTDPACEGQIVEGVMGYVGSAAQCGSVPLFRLRNPTHGDHLYTTSSAEVTAAEAGGYVLEGTTGYVWPGECGGAACTWNSPVHMRGAVTTAAGGFPTTWYGFPIGAATRSFSAISGSVTVQNSADLYAEVLFIVQYLPSGACTSGILPASTPEYGLPGAIGIANFIVKAPTAGTFTVPIDFPIPGGLPISNCLLLGLNGGTVTTAHDVTPSADLTVTYTAAATSQTLLGAGGEFCFGQNWGCQGATTDDNLSFAMVSPFAAPAHLVALYGDISDSTFDGSHVFGAPPAGAWTATNDFYVYHGAGCAAFGVASGVAGPGNYLATVPADATHLLSVPLSGRGIGVAEAQVFQPLASVAVAPGDCLVTLWGVRGGGGFDNETQVDVLVAP